MISRTTPSFWQAFAQLTAGRKAAAQRAFRLFANDPAHNSLQFKKLRGHASYWSVRVNLDIRAVGKRQARRSNGFGSARTTNSTSFSDKGEMAVVVLAARSTRLAETMPLIAEVLAQLPKLRPGTATLIPES